jgi:hypothetical protein
MHLCAKDGVKIRNFSIDLALTKLYRVQGQVNSYLVANFVKDYSTKAWYSMFDIFR